MAQYRWLNGGTRLVTLTMGGNDLGWVKTLETCLKVEVGPLHTALPVLGDHTRCKNAVSSVTKREATLQATLAALYASILDRAPDARVRVLGYPPLFPDRGKATSGCRVGGFSVKGLNGVAFVIAHDIEARTVQLETMANQDIAQAVRQVREQAPGNSRLQFIDTARAFGGYTGHTVTCGDKNRPAAWINQVTVSPGEAAHIAADIKAKRYKRLLDDIGLLVTRHSTRPRTATSR